MPRTTTSHFSGLLTSGCLLAVVCGCSKPQEVQTFPVRGTVTLDGEAAAGASVWLLPAHDVNSDVAKPPTFLIGGVADASGAFELRTNGNQSGVPAGYYMVGVTWPDPSVEPDREGGERGPDLMPAHVRKPQTSGIEYEVVASEPPEPLVLEIASKSAP